MKLIKYSLVFAFLFITFSSLCQDAAKDFETKTISIFKNGSAFYLKSGVVKAFDGSYKITENIPAALFGTLLIHSSNQELKNISSFNDEIQKNIQRRAKTFEDILFLNKGKKLKLHIGKDEVVEGVVEEIEKVKDTLNEQSLAYPNNVIVFKNHFIDFFPFIRS